MAERAADNELYDNHGGIVLTGSSNAYVATVARSTGGYHQELRLCAKANHTNTGASTLNLITPNSPSGIGAVAIRKNGSTALVAGDIVSGQYYDFTYDATNSRFQLLNPSTATIPAGSVGTTELADDAVTNAKLANMAESTIKGRAAGAGTGDPTDLSAAQVLTLLSAFSSVAVQSFTADGTYTPTSGMKFCLVISTGAGGGGGGADSDGNSAGSAGGGGAGATAIELFSAATIGANQTVTVGTGGTAGSNTGGNGGNGEDTTFGALHTAGGGVGGTGVASTVTDYGAGGAGGTPTGGLINIPGGGGTVGQADNTNNVATGGVGGVSFWGGPSVPPTRVGTGSTAGTNGAAYGSGANGAVSVDDATGAIGGVGADGIVVVIEFV